MRPSRIIMLLLALVIVVQQWALVSQSRHWSTLVGVLEQRVDELQHALARK